MVREREVVVVTGASSGVGRAVVREFAKTGARVGLLARGQEGLEGAARDVEALGGEALMLPCDAADAGQVELAAQQVERTWGRIDIWVNCAMLTVFGPFLDLTPEEFERVTETTYLSYVWGTQAALRRMKPRDHGTIVQVGSALAFRSIPLQSAYCGAKHAIKGFTESVRTELHHDKSHVRLTEVHLPAVNTPQFDRARNKMPCKPRPVGPIYQPELMAHGIVRAAHQRRRAVALGFPTVKAIIGEKVIPGLLDRYLGRMAYAAQLSDEPRPPRQTDNLLAPLPGDPGAHGRFDPEAKRHSPHVWANVHRGWLAAAAGLVAVGGVALARR